MLTLTHLNKQAMKCVPVDLSAMAEAVAEELQRNQPDRPVEFVIPKNLRAQGDPLFLRIVLENLLGNAWKFTSTRPRARIEIGARQAEETGETIFFVQDNGVGFDMTYANKLFGMFQRLHRAEEFPGTGVGLASVQRIVLRHGGWIRAKSALGQGATFFFTLSRKSGDQNE